MAQFAFGADGEALFARRKLKPTHVERALFGQGEQVHVASWPSFCLYRGLANALDTDVTRLVFDPRPQPAVEIVGAGLAAPSDGDEASEELPQPATA